MDDASSKFKSILNKFYWCYGKGGVSTRLYLIDDYDTELLSRQKDEIRSVAQMLYHSVHSTDDRESTMTALRLLFNKNSLLMLEYADFTRCLAVNEKVNLRDEYDSFRDNYVLDSSILNPLLKFKTNFKGNNICRLESSWQNVFYIYDIRFSAIKVNSFKKNKKPYKKFYLKLKRHKSF